MSFATPIAFLLQLDILELVQRNGPAEDVVLGILACFSVFSWTVILSKWTSLRGAARSNSRFLRAFRKANALEAAMVASEQYRPAPMVSVFDFGYEEVERQVKKKGSVTNRTALERSLQMGVNDEMGRLDRNMQWLAITASVTPFIGLLGTVLGIINAFEALGQQGSTSLRSIGPGISLALIATAFGLAAAIPAAIFYNLFGTRIREMGSRMEDFALEFLNLAERSFGE